MNHNSFLIGLYTLRWSLWKLILDLRQPVAWEIPGDDDDLIDSSEEEDDTSKLVSSLLKATGGQQSAKTRTCPGTSKVRRSSTGFLS